MIPIPRTSKATLQEIEQLKKLLIHKVVQERANSSANQPPGVSATQGQSQTQPRVVSGELTQGSELPQLQPQPQSHNVPPAPAIPPNIILNELSGQTKHSAIKELTTKVKLQTMSVGALFEGGIANVEITREPVHCDNPVTWLLWLMPEITPYRWQFERLMNMAGYLVNGKYGKGDKTSITSQNPLLIADPCANGSGKDLIFIAAAATWFSVIKPRNRVIITSSSHDQIKFQTEVHIRDLCNRANKKFGQLFKSVQYHHIVPELGSEIKLFVTDEAGRAEGYHPFPGGDMMLILNEAKSIPEIINDATQRCTGYTHRLEVSSPGAKSGFFHKHVTDPEIVTYPAPVVLGKYHSRKITSFDCPHIAASHIERLIYEYGIDSPLVKSSIYAEFSDLDSPVIITEYEYKEWSKSVVLPSGDDIGIGLDIAAGGDEDACWVRKGNNIIHKFFFRQQNLELAASLIDLQLLPWKHLQYTFRADNGGVGMGCIDNLTKLGWRVWRTNNQSPSFNKREFLNLGAEQWHHLKRLIARRDIPFVGEVDKLAKQLTSRLWRGMNTTQGKYALESKPEAKAAGRPSPDRADALVLCYASYRPKISKVEVKPPQDNMMNIHEFLRKLSMGQIMPRQPVKGARFTQLTGKI